MRLPITTGDLVADQRVAGFVVGDAQQGFGQAHQRHAFLAGQRIFLHQPFNAALLTLGAQGGDQRPGGGGKTGAQRGRHFGQRQQGRDHLGLRRAAGGGYALP